MVWNPSALPVKSRPSVSRSIGNTVYLEGRVGMLSPMDICYISASTTKAKKQKQYLVKCQSGGTQHTLRRLWETDIDPVRDLILAHRSHWKGWVGKNHRLLSPRSCTEHCQHWAHSRLLRVSSTCCTIYPMNLGSYQVSHLQVTWGINILHASTLNSVKKWHSLTLAKDCQRESINFSYQQHWVLSSGSRDVF